MLLADLDKSVRSFLIAASCLGQLCCVTLARRPWQTRSMQTFYPLVAETWNSLDVKVRYAQEEKIIEYGPRNVVDMEDIFNDHDEGKYVKKKMKSMMRILKDIY